MSNSYCMATVEPTIPSQLLTELDKQVFKLLGATIEEHDGECYIFFTDGVWLLLDNYMDEELSEYAVTDEDKEFVKSIIENDYSVQEILQVILNRPNINTRTFTVMGSFTCDKMRPGEFGGWVSLVSADNILTESTHSMLYKMKEVI